MVWQIGGTIGEIIGVEERDRIHKGSCYKDGYQQGNDWMAGSTMSISRKGVSQRMFRFKKRRLRGAISESVFSLGLIERA